MISIVIPTYRRADLLDRLLNSIQAQTYGDYEVIVVDDASPNTADYDPVIAHARKRFPRFHYLRLETNSGAPHARNVGIGLAHGEWVALVDDDDEWLPQKLERQQAMAATATPTVGLIYTWTRVVDGNGQMLNQSCPDIEGSAAKHIFQTNFILSPSVMVRQSVFTKVGTFDETLPSCQDWDMWARILADGYECRVVREVLCVYHRHGQASVGLSPRALDGYRIFLRKHWPNILRHTGPVNWLKKALLQAKTLAAR